ncbi:AlpA family phage regulatory protein [Acidobacteria bacterium AH-259-G07]|nr:AlpA family phage regulatory protein [Acidobacteria bacterium AH-259-G07]
MSMQKIETESKKLLRYSDLVQQGIVNNRMTLKRWIEAGDFPSPVRLGINTIAWHATEVKEWLDAREQVVTQ